MSKTTKIRLLAATCVAALALSAPGVAVAAPAGQGYDESNLLAGLDESPASNESAPRQGSNSNANSESDRLPFTGFDVAILAALGAALAGTGFAVRRVARPTST